MRAIFIKRALVVILLDIAAGAAFAQFVWIDAKGTRQYSDQPPPSSIPKKNILKEPALELRTQQGVHSMDTGKTENGEAVATAVNAAANGSSEAATKAGKEPLTAAQKNMEFNKRYNEQVEKDKKMAEDAKNLAIKNKNCERAQSYVRSLQSGERITSTDKNGEKSYMSDEKRAQEISEANKVVDSCK